MIYLDSCALVKLIRTESETPALKTYAERRELTTCDVAMAEVPRVILRADHDDQHRLVVDQAVLDAELATAAGLLDGCVMVVVDAEIYAQVGAYAADPLLRTLDTIHLVAARSLGPALSAFVTYDKQLARAAKEARLPLVQPA